eukprot:scaffold11855_cov61-Phaeocystis_antarctica.AAC.4
MGMLRGSGGMPGTGTLLAAARVAAPFLCAASAAASASLVVARFRAGLLFRRNLLGETLATTGPAGGCTLGLAGWRRGVASVSASVKRLDACTSAFPSHCRCSTIAAHPMAVASAASRAASAAVSAAASTRVRSAAC